MPRLYIILIFVCTNLSLLPSCSEKDNDIIEIESWVSHYTERNLSGCFVLLDPTQDILYVHNKNEMNTPFTPASTFKICNSLIGLETAVIPDVDHVIPWDSIQRNPEWDKDHDLRSAFRNSTVWYYQELARRVGKDTMQAWVNRSGYGNRKAGPNVDTFWLEGDLRITPMQQVEFLRSLNELKLPFSEKNMHAVKAIMLIEETNNYRIYGKTGWGTQDSIDIGWFVGFIETDDKYTYFANCVMVPGAELEEIERAVEFDRSRINITMSILKNEGYIE
jgi:beta-lactamase class D